MKTMFCTSLCSGPLSHLTWMVDVLSAVLHIPPSGTLPSETVSVSVAVPAAPQVKFGFWAFGLSNDPLEDDHE